MLALSATTANFPYVVHFISKNIVWQSINIKYDVFVNQCSPESAAENAEILEKKAPNCYNYKVVTKFTEVLHE